LTRGSPITNYSYNKVFLEKRRKKRGGSLSKGISLPKL
jgi:hypothetical protein